jgi:hypothetical protein
MSSELFPNSDKMGSVEKRDGRTRIGTVEIVAYDYQGERFCVECATEHSEIDKERFHSDPYSVPHGGSVRRRSMQECEITYHCGNPNCGKQIPE